MSNNRLGVTTAHVNPEAQRLIRRYYHQILGGMGEHDQLFQSYAISFRPGDNTGSFLGKELRPIGQSVLVVLSYGFNPETGRPTMPLRGYRAHANLDGSVSYCEDCRFWYDAARRPFVGARRRILDPQRNPSLCQLMYAMDAACRRALPRVDRLPIVPQFPRILLGFAPSDPPEFESTPALYKFAAKELDIPVDRLGCNGDVLFERFLQDLWERQLVQPGSNGNDTGLVLIDAEICTQGRRALRVFEDFRTLVGMRSWNPVREVEVLQVDNPAKQVLAAHGFEDAVDLGEVLNGDQLEVLESAMREQLGGVGDCFAVDEILDALLAPGRPAIAWKQSLPLMRSKLAPQVAECTTDDDLLEAARSPARPLISSGACRTQVLCRVADADEAAFRFSANLLKRRLDADLSVDPHGQASDGLMRPMKELVACN